MQDITESKERCFFAPLLRSNELFQDKITKIFLKLRNSAEIMESIFSWNLLSGKVKPEKTEKRSSLMQMNTNGSTIDSKR